MCLENTVRTALSVIRRIRWSIIVCAALLASSPDPAAALDTSARTAILIEMDTGAVLLKKDADRSIPPASMSKLMTLNMVFEALADGRLSLNDKLPVSEKAWRMGGSKMFVRVGNSVRVADLLRGVIIQSGNDACVVLAEGLAGSEAAFAEQMNVRAAELGMTKSHFVNATGWPAEGDHMSTRDLAFIAQRIIRKFPQFYPLFSETKFTWAGITQDNRNPLLGLNIGADGMKTGHTQEAGFGLIGSAVSGDRRLLLVISGLPSMRARAEESQRLISWGIREFTTRTLFKKGDAVDEAAVWIGDAPNVPLVASRDVRMTVPVADQDKVTAVVRYDGPVPAPILKGQPLARLEVSAPGISTISIPLEAGANVAQGGYVKRLGAAARILLQRLLSKGPDADADAAQ